jgi:hypothetical protein
MRTDGTKAAKWMKTATSVPRRFWAALDQANLHDRQCNATACQAPRLVSAPVSLPPGEPTAGHAVGAVPRKRKFSGYQCLREALDAQWDFEPFR